MIRLVMIAVVLGAGAGAAWAAEPETYVVGCVEAAEYEGLKTRHPASAKYIYDGWLDSRFQVPGAVCLFVNGEAGVDTRAQHLEKEFVAEFKKLATTVSIPTQTGKWSCLTTDRYAELSIKHQTAFRVIEDNHLLRSYVMRDGAICVRLDALEAIQRFVAPELLAAVRAGDIVDDSKLKEESAMRWEKVKVDRYEVARTFPKSKLKKMDKEMTGAAIAWWANSDIGDRAVVHRCAVTSSDWTTWTDSTTKDLVGRSVQAACAIQVEPNVCVIYYDGCRQDHLGLHKFGGCYYQAYDYQSPERIDCKKVK